MIRVVRTVEVDEQWTEYDPSWKLGLGLLTFLDAKNTGSFLVEPGSTVRIHRPDGTFIDRVVAGVSPGGEPVAFFLSKTRPHEIPDQSRIELPPFCIPLFTSPE